MAQERAWSIVATLSSLTLIACLFVLPVRAPNLVQAKADVMRYVTNQQYHKDLQLAANKGAYWLAQAKGKQQAVVFDIDETLLSNYQQMKANGFGGNAQLFRAQDLLAQATVIRPIYGLYQQALSLGYHTFIITGRRPEARAATIKNLTQAGYHQWNSLFFWPADSKQTAADYKASIRQQIEQQGYQIILNVGDQWSDLTGTHALHHLKLPNPFYLIPKTRRRAVS